MAWPSLWIRSTETAGESNAFGGYLPPEHVAADLSCVHRRFDEKLFPGRFGGNTFLKPRTHGEKCAARGLGGYCRGGYRRSEGSSVSCH